MTSQENARVYNPGLNEPFSQTKGNSHLARIICGFSSQQDLQSAKVCRVYWATTDLFFFSISFFGQSTDWSLKHCECPEKCREMVAFILFPFWRSFNQHSNFHFMIINTGLPYDSGITLLGIYPEKTNSKRYMLPYLHSGTIHNSQEVEAN